MIYIPQQFDINILNQSKRIVYSKIELLDKSFKVVEYLDGELIDDSYSIDADSDIRTTYNLTLAVKNSSFVISSNSKIWFDKYIRLYIGLYSIRLREIVWYPVGIFIFENAGYSYDATTKELSLSCADRMSELTNSRNGQLGGISTTIPLGADIRTAIKDTVVQLGDITKYRIDNIDKTVPYDLEFGVGVTVYDIIKELRDLYPGWETYFEGEYFICQPYPTLLSDPVVIDSRTLSPLIISENTNIDFTQVKNVIEVWGKCLEDKGQVCAVTKLMSAEPSESKKAEDLQNETTDNISYVIEPTSPFCCDLEGFREIRQVKSGGEYDNIYSKDLATQRAEYDLWQATDLLDNITLDLIEIPWLSVNQKIEYTSNITGKTETYIVKKKNGSSTGGTMTINCVKFQPLYPWTN